MLANRYRQIVSMDEGVTVSRTYLGRVRLQRMNDLLHVLRGDMLRNCARHNINECRQAYYSGEKLVREGAACLRSQLDSPVQQYTRTTMHVLATAPIFRESTCRVVDVYFCVMGIYRGGLRTTWLLCFDCALIATTSGENEGIRPRGNVMTTTMQSALFSMLSLQRLLAAIVDARHCITSSVNGLIRAPGGIGGKHLIGVSCCNAQQQRMACWLAKS